MKKKGREKEKERNVDGSGSRILSETFMASSRRCVDEKGKRRNVRDDWRFCCHKLCCKLCFMLDTKRAGIPLRFLPVPRATSCGDVLCLKTPRSETSQPNGHILIHACPHAVKQHVVRFVAPSNSETRATNESNGITLLSVIEREDDIVDLLTRYFIALTCFYLDTRIPFFLSIRHTDFDGEALVLEILEMSPWTMIESMSKTGEVAGLVNRKIYK